jgi:hypothetical protein
MSKGTDIAVEFVDVTAHWLAYKRLTKFDSLSEALLIIPIAEYLQGHRFAVTPEQDSVDLFEFGGAGEINYDIAARSTETNYEGKAEIGDLRLILEMKYVKASSEQRILRDLIKLALPPAKFDWLRFSLVVLSDPVKSTLIEDVMKTATSRIAVDQNGKCTITQNGASKLLPLTGNDLKYIKKWMEIHSPENLEFTVECPKVKSADKFGNVAILSVGRQN